MACGPAGLRRILGDWEECAVTALAVKFDAQEVVVALGEVGDGDVLVLSLTGDPTEECGALPFEGEDVVIILKEK